MKTLRLFFAVVLITATNLVSAQVTTQNGFEDFVRGGTDDANVLFNYYMMPVMKGIGYGFNNGWSHIRLWALI